MITKEDWNESDYGYYLFRSLLELNVDLKLVIVTILNFLKQEMINLPPDKKSLCVLHEKLLKKCSEDTAANELKETLSSVHMLFLATGHVVTEISQKKVMATLYETYHDPIAVFELLKTNDIHYSVGLATYKKYYQDAANFIRANFLWENVLNNGNNKT